jgi:ribosome-binding factor A
MAHREYNRSDRISSQIRRELAVMVHEAVRGGDIPSVSVSDVEVTRDLAHANVYVTALIGDKGPEAVKLLNEVSREFRRELARIMKTRTVPELHFKYDDSVDKGERIEQLLREKPVRNESDESGED